MPSSASVRRSTFAGDWSSGERPQDRNEHRRQRKRHDDGDEQPDLHRHVIAREAGDDHQAPAEPAEDQKDGEHRLGRQVDHEIVPSDLTSTPRAISTCDRTGSDGNMRSMIMRT